MKKFLKILKYSIGVIIIILMISLIFPTWTPHIKGVNSISVLEQVEINGSKYAIMIRGKDKDNPVIISVHGGPGCPEMPYADKYQDLLESKFTIINYDQRASGKSYHFFEDYSNFSTDLLVEDLLALTDYITERFGKEKVILMAHSFGTDIATQAAYKSPERYEAYIGIGQMSNTIDSEIDNLNYCINQAKEHGNADDVLNLQGLNSKIVNGESFVPRNYVAKYGGASRLIDNPDGNIIDMLFSSQYNLLDVIRYHDGLTLSQKNLLEDLLNKPLSNLVTKLELPYYFIMGKYDHMTSTKAAKYYFNVLEGEKKEFIVFNQSAHYPQFEEKEKFYEWMCDTFIE